MPLLDEKTFHEVTDALEAHGELKLVERLKMASANAESSRAEGASELVEDDALTSGEAANILGVSSINTVKNWLEGGFFPGAYKTAGGHWRFPRSEVEAVALQMKNLSDRNERGELSPPDHDEPGEPPLL